MKEVHVTFPCGDLTLEGVCHLPEGSGPFAAVVVCNPHPFYGGAMDNHVVLAVCHALCERGIAAFRFNTRGVGQSQGSLGGGIAEQEDVKAAISFVASMEQIEPKVIGIAGYSFGAIPAFFATPAEEVQAVAAISPPLSVAPFEGLKNYSKPKLIISGSLDDFTPVQDLQRFGESLPEPKQCEVIPGAAHFWWGYVDQLAERVASFFANALKG